MKWQNNWIPGTGLKEVLLNISSNELRILQDAVKPEYQKALKKYEKLRDIHESGEATEKQCDQMSESLECVETINGFLGLK